MHKALLPVIVLGLFVVACGELKLPAPTTTAVPTPGPMPRPSLIKEVDLETQTGTAYTLDWSPDGETLAVASGYEITLIGRNLSRTQAVLDPVGGALAVTWNPDQTRFATANGYRNRTVKVWDWIGADSRLVLVEEIQAGSDQYGVFWSPDGKLLASLADDDKSTFQIWDTATWEQIQKFDLPYATPRRTSSWSADSSTLYGAGEAGGQVKVFALNVADGNVREVAEFPIPEIEVFAFSPDAKKLVVAGPRGVAQILEVASGEILTGFQSVDQPVDLGWSPDGSTLAILGYKTTLQLWDVSD